MCTTHLCTNSLGQTYTSTKTDGARATTPAWHLTTAHIDSTKWTLQDWLQHLLPIVEPISFSKFHHFNKNRSVFIHFVEQKNAHIIISTCKKKQIFISVLHAWYDFARIGNTTLIRLAPSQVAHRWSTCLQSQNVPIAETVSNDQRVHLFQILIKAIETKTCWWN